MTVINDSFENAEFLAFLYEQVNDHRAELTSPLLAPEDRLGIEAELDTALAAIAAFES